VLCLVLACAACASRSVRLAALEQGIARQVAAMQGIERRLGDLAVAPEGARALADGSSDGTLYYGTAVVRFSPLDPRHGAPLGEMLAAVLEDGGAAEFEYRGPAGTRRFVSPWLGQGFAEVPPHVLYAASFASAPAHRGAELDLRVPVDGEPDRRVTIWNGPTARVVAADASGDSLPPVGAARPNADALGTRYGVGPVERWAPDELESLELSLALLDARELAVIAGLPFRRAAAAPPSGAASDPQQRECGLFRFEGTARSVSVFDCAFEADDLGFVGSLDRSLKPSIRLILHEIGHAISVVPLIEFFADLSARHEEADTLVKEFNRLGRRVPPAEGRRFDEMKQGLDAIDGTLARASAMLQAASPAEAKVIREFAREGGAVAGFTPYGRTSLVEGFAEAFSLYRADPEACRRISPGVFAYFEAGRHVGE